MASWRDSTSPQAQNDLDELLNASLGFAQHQLAEHGEFFPYAVAARTDGQTEMIAARPDSAEERPTSAEVIASCRVVLTERRDELRAAAIVADVPSRRSRRRRHPSRSRTRRRTSPHRPAALHQETPPRHHRIRPTNSIHRHPPHMARLTPPLTAAPSPGPIEAHATPRRLDNPHLPHCGRSPPMPLVDRACCVHGHAGPCAVGCLPLSRWQERAWRAVCVVALACVPGGAVPVWMRWRANRWCGCAWPASILASGT